MQEPCSPTSTLRTMALPSPPLPPQATLLVPGSCSAAEEQANLLDTIVAASETTPGPAARQQDPLVQPEVAEPAPSHPPPQVRQQLMIEDNTSKHEQCKSATN